MKHTENIGVHVTFSVERIHEPLAPEGEAVVLEVDHKEINSVTRITLTPAQAAQLGALIGQVACTSLADLKATERKAPQDETARQCLARA